MPTAIAKRRNFIINFVFFVLVLGLAYLFFKFAFWPTAPFLVSFLIAMLLQKPVNKLEEKTKIGRGIWSIVMVVLLILIVTGPLAVLITWIIQQVIAFVKDLATSLGDMETLVNNIEDTVLDVVRLLPDSMYDAVAKPVIEAFNDFKVDFDISKIGISLDTIKTPLNSVVGMAKNIPGTLLGLVIGIIACIFMTKDYRPIANFINAQMPEGKKNLLPEIKGVFFNTLGKMFRAYGVIMSITFVELFVYLSILKFIGFLNLSFNFIFVIALGIAIFDIIPVLGAGGVLIPWAAYCLLVGDFKLAIGIVVIYILLLAFRQYIEPKVVGDQLGVHPIITLAGLYFGLKLFGFMGMFIVPICIMTLKALNDNGRIKIWKSGINVPEKPKKSMKLLFKKK